MAEASDSPKHSARAAQRSYGMLRRYDHDDEFANFSFNPPRPRGRFRSFSRSTSKYQSVASLSSSKECLATGSNTNLATFGSSQNLSQLDAVKRMNLQEDARSRRISAEIMKHRLYESVIASPRRRRLSVRADYMGMRGSESEMEMSSLPYTARMVQSLPVTPAHSQNVTPVQSPTSSRRFFFSFFSRGTTPEEEDDAAAAAAAAGCLRPPPDADSWKGLASIFKPSPRCIPVVRAPSVTDMLEDSEDIENRLHGVGDGEAGADGLYGGGGGGGGGKMENGERGIFVNRPPRVRPGKVGPPPQPVTEKDMNTEPPPGDI